MGMYDYIDFKAFLPKGRNKSRRMMDMNENLSQSKSTRLWETEKFGDRAYNEGCVRITIDSDGSMLDPDMNSLAWSGILRFYGSGINSGNWEYEAKFIDGIMNSIVEIVR